MHRHRVARLHQLVEALQLVPRRVAGDVDHVVVRRHHPAAAPARLSCTRRIAALVAGDHARGEDDGVALPERDVRMRVGGDLGERRARLALAAGADDQQRLVGEEAGLLLRHEGREVLEVAAFARRRLGVAQRAAEERDLPARPPPPRGRCSRRRAMLVAKQVTATRPFSGRMMAARLRRTSASLPECPSTSALVESHTMASTPSLAEPREGRLVGRRADQRLGVELPVAGVQHQPVPGADGQRLRLRHRMGDAEELQVEGRQRQAAARAARSSPAPRRQPRLAAACAAARRRRRGRRRSGSGAAARDARPRRHGPHARG